MLNYYVTDDFFGNPKLIKTNDCECEIIMVVYPHDVIKKYKFNNGYRKDPEEILKTITEEVWNKFESQVGGKLQEDFISVIQNPLI
jgi:hypothetical protein